MGRPREGRQEQALDRQIELGDERLRRQGTAFFIPSVGGSAVRRCLGMYLEAIGYQSPTMTRRASGQVIGCTAPDRSSEILR